MRTGAESKSSNTSVYNNTSFSKTFIDKFHSSTEFKSSRKRPQSHQPNLFPNLDLEQKSPFAKGEKININDYFDVVNSFITPHNASKTKDHIEFVNIMKVRPGFELKSLKHSDEPSQKIEEFKKYAFKYQINTLGLLDSQYYPIKPIRRQTIEFNTPFTLDLKRPQSSVQKQRKLSTTGIIDNTNYKSQDYLKVKGLSPQNKISLNMSKKSSEINEKYLFANSQAKKLEHDFKIVKPSIKLNSFTKGLHLRINSGKVFPEKLDIIGKKSIINPLLSKKKSEFAREFQLALFGFEQMTARSLRRENTNYLMKPIEKISLNQNKNEEVTQIMLPFKPNDLMQIESTRDLIQIDSSNDAIEIENI